MREGGGSAWQGRTAAGGRHGNCTPTAGKPAVATGGRQPWRMPSGSQGALAWWRILPVLVIVAAVIHGPLRDLPV